MNLTALRTLALLSMFAAALTACIPDQSCSNPPHIRRSSIVSTVELGATRQNPVELGDVGSYGDWDLRILEFAQISDLVHIRLDVAYTGSDDDQPGDVGELKFCLAGSKHTLYLDATNPYSDDGPSPIFGDGYGEEQVRNGWLTFEDIADDDDDFVLAVREEASILYRDADFMYFELKSDTNIVTDRSKTKRPTSSGKEIDSPIPIGEAAVTSAFEIEISESYVGAEAEEVFSSANRYADTDPRSGNTYFLFKVSVTNTARGNSPASISSTQFSADGFTEAIAAVIAETSGSEASGSEVTESKTANQWLDLPGEKLEATLYQGGSAEGWVILEVDVDTEPLVVYDPKLGTGLQPDEDRRYFLLTTATIARGDRQSSSSETTSATATPTATPSATPTPSRQPELPASVAISATGGARSEVFQLREGRYRISLAISDNDRRFAVDTWQLEVLRNPGNIVLLERNGRGASAQWGSEVLIEDDSWKLWVVVDVANEAEWNVSLQRLGDAPTPGASATRASSSQPSSASALVPTVTAGELVRAWNNNPVRAENTYEDKVFEISGVIESIDNVFGQLFIVLTDGSPASLEGVQCLVDNQDREWLSTLSTNQTVTVQGRIDGKSLLNVVVDPCGPPPPST